MINQFLKVLEGFHAKMYVVFNIINNNTSKKGIHYGPDAFATSCVSVQMLLAIVCATKKCVSSKPCLLLTSKCIVATTDRGMKTEEKKRKVCYANPAFCKYFHYPLTTPIYWLVKCRVPHII